MNGTNAQGPTLRKEEEHPSTESLHKPWERQLWVHLQGKCFSAKIEKDAPEDRKTGTPGKFRGKKALFSITELTPKVKQPQESTIDKGMRSAKQTASQPRTSKNNLQPVAFEKQAAQPDERVQYRGVDNMLMEQPTGRWGQSAPNSSASNLGFRGDI